MDYGEGGALTIEHLRRLYDFTKSVLYVHPDDLEQPLVEACREHGYEIVTRETMVKGKAFMQDITSWGVIDFESGQASLGKNTSLSFFGLPAHHRV